MDEWVCRSCGATYPEETRPCLQCASDDVTHVDDDAAEDYSIEAVAFRCPNCGQTVPKHTPPCDRCGNMTLETVRGDAIDDTSDAFPTVWYDPVGPLYTVRRRLWTFATYTVVASAVAGFFAFAGTGNAADFGSGLLRVLLALFALEALAIVASVVYDHLHERDVV
jgi:ribosomal protein L40E